jgi:hypothetical protein
MRKAWFRSLAGVPFSTLPAWKTFQTPKNGVKVGALEHRVRLACTGNPNGPSLYHLLEVIGKEKTMAKIERAHKNI